MYISRPDKLARLIPRNYLRKLWALVPLSEITYHYFCDKNPNPTNTIWHNTEKCLEVRGKHVPGPLGGI